MARRNSQGQVLPPAPYDARSYDERQMPDLFPPEAEETFDSLDRRIDVFLNRWLWRTENRAVVKQELEQLIASAQPEITGKRQQEHE